MTLVTEAVCIEVASAHTQTYTNRSRHVVVSFHYVTKGAESEQPVGAPFYQWVGCRDHAGITCFAHSGSW